MQPSVYITFDVECSMGGAWRDGARRPVPPSRAMMGQFGQDSFGLPLICDILAEGGLVGTFFLDPFADEQGYPGQTEPVCKLLLDRGHDVQLHIHPNHYHYGLKQQGKHFPYTDQMADLSPQAQLDLLGEGCRRIAQWTGRAPAAFRAGNMGADEQTLAQLPAVGIGIDSSYTFPYLGRQCRFTETQAYNGSKWYGNVLELALSGFRQFPLPGLHRAKPVDLVGICFSECRDAVTGICRSGVDAVMILHSFSLMKVKNSQYEGGRLNAIVAGRFRRFCQWLAQNAADLPARTFRQLAQTVRDGHYQARAIPPLRLPGVLRPYLRKAVQLYNRPYWT